MTGPSRRSSITPEDFSQDGPRQTRRRRNRDPRPGRGPCARAAAPRTPRASLRLELVRDERRREADAKHRLRVMGETAVTRSRVASRHPRRQHRAAAERGGCVDRLCRGEAAVAQRGSGADDARPDRADDRVGTCGAPRTRAPSRRSPPARRRRRTGGRDREREQPPRAKRAHRIRQRHRQSASRHLHVGDLHPAQRRAHGNDLRVQRAAHDRHAGERLGERLLLPVRDGATAATCTAASSRARPVRARARGRA